MPKVRSLLDLGLNLALDRALDLGLRLGKLLLASGDAAEEVEAGTLAVVYRYGLVRCDVNVTFTMLTIAHQATPAEPAWTASRAVQQRGGAAPTTPGRPRCTIWSARSAKARPRSRRHTGGLFAPLPDRALVAAVQDGLTAFYIT